MSEDPLHRDNPTGVLLACAINHSHAAAPDFLQNFVMTEAPFVVGHVGFCKGVFERFAGGLAFGFKSLAQETVDAGSVIKSGYRATLRAFRWILDYVHEGTRRPGCFLHQAVAASVAHKYRISSSTSAGFSTV